MNNGIINISPTNYSTGRQLKSWRIKPRNLQINIKLPDDEAHNHLYHLPHPEVLDS